MQRPSLVALFVSALLPSFAIAQNPAPPPSIYVAVSVDSGYAANPTDQPVVVFSHRFNEASTDWLQFHFTGMVNLPEGSFLRMTSARDGGMQRQDGRAVADWGQVSAMFNGGDVLLELVAGPKTTANRVEVDGLWRGVSLPAGPATICGVDNRALSTDPRQGRLWLGCSGWMISPDVMLTAGHCTTTGTRILEMNVPLSTSGGSLVRANPNDQYPYTELAGLNAGVGSDWRVCRVLPNSTHGQLPTQRNGGQWYTLGPVPGSPAGQNIRVTGYGTTSSPVSPTWTQVQKTHVGTLSTVAATSLCYATDTTGGNSGSPVIHENTGAAIGIHTHGGCSSSGSGCNSGTRIDRTDLQAAIRTATGSTAAFSTYGQGCPSPNAFYELFTSGNDLSGRSFLLSAGGGGWTVANCTSSCWDASFGTGLNVADDQLTSGLALGFSFPLPGGGSTTAIAADSNGWIGMISGQFSASDYTESVAEFLAEGMRLAVFWDDFNPASAGDVYFKTVAGRAVVTWAGVPEFGSTNSNSFQAQFFANGDVILSYQGGVAAGDGLVGFSGGAVPSDPGSLDLTASIPFSTGSGGVPLQITASALPILGTTINLGIGSVPAGIIAGAMNLGFAQQNIDLTAAGMPACSLLTTIDGWFPLPATTPSSSTPLSLPNIPALNGAVLFAQGVALVPGINAIGAILSNGGRLTLGT